MNYYEQFYDDLEFCDEEEDEPYRDDKHDPGYGYEEDWSHRDEKYRQPDRESYRDHPYKSAEHSRYYTRGYEGRDRDEWERDEWERHEERGRSYGDRGWSPRNRGRGFPDRGRGFSDRGRGFKDRGRGFADRGRGFGDRGRGYRDRGWPGPRGRGSPRGTAKSALAMNFVKASEPTGLESAESKGPEAGSDKGKVDGGAVATSAPLPVLPSYGYGPGSDFQDFGSVSTEGVPITNYQAADPGVPGLENETVVQHCPVPHTPPQLLHRNQGLRLSQQW